MRAAVNLVRSSPDDNARVGVVIVRGRKIIATGYKGEDGTRHAESVALGKVAGQDLSQAHVYVTLEPCVRELVGGATAGCASLLVDAGVKVVYIGRYDNNPSIHRRGWKHLMDNSVTCRDFTEDFRAELDELTSTFTGFFQRRSDSQRGTASFDWRIPPKTYELSMSHGAAQINWVTRWSTADALSIHAYAEPGGDVVSPDYATAIDQIDDADALTYDDHAALVPLHGVVVFRNQHGHALCRVRKIDAPPPHGPGPGARLEFTFELRPRQVPDP